MPKISGTRLGLKIAVYLMIGVSIFALFMIYYVYYTTRDRSRAELLIYDIHGKTMLKNFSGNIILGILSANHDVLTAEMDKLFADTTISYAVIYDTESKVIAERFQGQLKSAQFRFPSASPPAPGKIIVQDVKSLDGEPFRDFWAVVVSPADEKTPMGYARIGISVQELNRELNRAWQFGVALIVAVMVMGGGLILVTLRIILPPINRLASAAREIGQGRYDARVEVTSSDEIGLLTQTFNEMVVNIKNQTERAEAMIERIAEAIMMLTETTGQLLTVTTEQAAIVQEVVSTAEEMASTASRIADSTASVQEASQKATEASVHGKELVESSIKDMEQISEQVNKGTTQIVSLAEQAQMIGGVIDLIEEISEQTNLLALNAAIEAAGAGDSGKRFAVVAAEVRHLANRTLESTESVRKMVNAIRSSTSAIVMLSENEQKAVVTGAESVKRTGEYFQHILDMVETTRHSASEIGLITRQQSTATSQMVVSIREVEQVAREVEKGVKEIESLMGGLKDLSDRLRMAIDEKTAS